ncbi:uncharacterized protein CEXT_455541 [Caerostris extrusa]|uniref:EGF-like domain-containing protein n=1 Tax=Caerostris extrusa TaxID=172846 RepID=A0AAV4QKC7_CAEEX|nr:uncharacterized protein CEXT_455541 [Caerostris extrusa]
MKFCVHILVILYCLCVLETISSEVNFVTSDTIATDYGLNARDEEISNMDILDAWGSDCTCLNGKCVNRCPSSYWTSEGGCIRVEPVCECDPEFGKVNDSTCAYCDCGKGINCSFSVIMNEIWMKNCFCPEGYHGGTGYSCLPNCDEKRPCQNGGTCDEGTCLCKRGTAGVFCEEIYWCKTECKPRLTVDCVYNQEQEYFDCICKDKSLYFDYRDEICKPCSCGNGTCKYYGIHELRCDCAPGYQEFKGECKPCDCGGKETCEFDQKGFKTCKCKTGYVSRQGICAPCNCGTNPSSNIPCSLDILGVKTCHCPSGSNYTKGVCEDVYLCQVNNPCHPTAICVDLVDKTRCECPKGYAAKHYYPGPGEPCEDVDECLDMSVCAQHKNLQCVNLPGTYKCECLPGFEPISLDAHSHDTDCKSHKETWMPAGVAILVILGLFAIGAGLFVYRTRRSRY